MYSTCTATINRQNSNQLAISSLGFRLQPSLTREVKKQKFKFGTLSSYWSRKGANWCRHKYVDCSIMTRYNKTERDLPNAPTENYDIHNIKIRPWYYVYLFPELRFYMMIPSVFINNEHQDSQELIGAIIRVSFFWNLNALKNVLFAQSPFIMIKTLIILITYTNDITDVQSKHSCMSQEVSPAKITRGLRDILLKSCCVINMDRKRRK